jgi:hypothetical protein
MIVSFSGIAMFILSCSSKTISTKYYYRNEKVLDKIEETYKQLNEQYPFTVAFTDRKFNTISFEIITDTLRYIYRFNINEKRLADTLVAYHLNAPKIIELIQLMRSIHCTWVNKFTYYVDEKKNELIFMSIKPISINAPFSPKKYYTLTYFPKPQYFDSTGQLLDKRTHQRLRKINGDIFYRIDNKVCYTISGNFR